MVASTYSAVSLFSGCGGSDLGLLRAGIEPVWANEKNEFACETYERVLPGFSIHAGDITGISRFPSADILSGCYPCQGYSQGGRRTPTDGINFLYREFDRALRQIRPLAFIVENVNGMRFGKNSKLLKNQLVRFRSAGYRVWTNELNARDFGLAQRRQRLFLVGIRSSERVNFQFPSPTVGPTTKYDYATVKDAIGHLDVAEPGSYNDEPFHWYYLSRNRRPQWYEQSPCIVAHWRHVPLHPSSPPLKKIGADEWRFEHDGPARRMSYRECALLQGFDDPTAFDFGEVRDRFRVVGNAVPPPLFENIARNVVIALNQRL